MTPRPSLRCRRPSLAPLPPPALTPTALAPWNQVEPAALVLASPAPVAPVVRAAKANVVAAAAVVGAVVAAGKGRAPRVARTRPVVRKAPKVPRARPRPTAPSPAKLAPR